MDYRHLFLASPNAYLVLSRDLTIVDTNESYLALLGLTREQLVGRRLFDALPVRLQDAARELKASFAQVIELKRPHAIPLLHYPVPVGDGWQDRYWTIKNAPLLDHAGNVVGIINCPVDVTGLVARGGPGAVNAGSSQGPTVQMINEQLENERRRFRQLMQQAPGFVAVGRGPQHIFELANNAYYQLVGHRDILGKPVRQALPELAGQGFYELLDCVYTSGEPFIGRAMPILVQTEREGPLVERHIDFIYQPIFDEDGNVSGIFVQGHDVTEAHELSRTVSHQAAHDALTGLVNRREFESRLARAVDAHATRRGPHSLLYLDLDQFKVVNDTCGHAAGDELLRQVSARLCEHVAVDQTVARLGGDEFGILLLDTEGPRAAEIAERLREAVDAIGFCWGKRMFGCSASLGVVTFDASMGGMAGVLAAADSACFMAKERGRNRVQVHCPGDHDMAARRREMDWVSRLREALAERRLVLYAQRIEALGRAPETVTRMELLLRLREADGQLVPPMAFIPAAERYGLMSTIDRFVIEEAFARLASLEPELRSTIHVSINLSGATLNEDRLLSFVRGQVDRHRCLATQICFEVTETAALQNLSRAAEAMLELKAMGFRFALDDFGSGMSSLCYLKQLPVDYLKIDGAFVRHIVGNPTDAAIVEAMARVASVMGIRTIAEYVDREETRALLESLAIDYVQGFCIHEPEPFEDMLRSLSRAGAPAA